MATARTIPGPFRTIARSCRASNLSAPTKCTRRTFFDIPGSSNVQSLTAKRILPYPAASLYAIIADIDAYSNFLPYCVRSRVTSQSQPDASGHRWPAKADLTVGWQSYTETYSSRILCVPGRIVEAHSGVKSPPSTIPIEQLEHYPEMKASTSMSVENDLFESLLTRWVLDSFPYQPPSGQPERDMTRPKPIMQTEVRLNIEYRFRNPVYAALTAALNDKIAGLMIDAFEKRATSILEGPGALDNEQTEDAKKIQTQ